MLTNFPVIISVPLHIILIRLGSLRDCKLKKTTTLYFLFDLNSLGLNTYCIKSIILVEWDIICSSWQMSSIYFQMVSAEKFRGATSSVLNYVCAVAIIQWIKGGSFSIDKKRFWRTCFKSVACLISFYLTYPMFFPYFAVNSISVLAIPCQTNKTQ